MKKLLVLVLCLMIVLGCGSGLAAGVDPTPVQGEWVDSQATIIPNLDVTMEDWMETEENRALAMGCMIAEIISVYEGEAFNDFFTSGTITGYLSWADTEEGQTLVGLFECQDTQELWACLVILETGEISVWYDVDAERGGEAVMQQLSGDGNLADDYYICDETALLTALQSISDALESDE